MNTETKVSELIKHYADIKRYALKITRNYEDAEDLVQETYKKAILAIPRNYRDNGKDVMWLTVIAKNTWKNILKRRCRMNFVFDSEETLKFIPAKEDSKINYSEILNEITEERGLFSESYISKKQLQILNLKYIQGLSHEEISERLNIPLGTSLSRALRGKRRLIELLKK